MTPLSEGLASWRASEGTRRLVLYALLAALAYAIAAIPGSLTLRVVAAGSCVALAGVVLVEPRVRVYAHLLQVLNVGALVVLAVVLYASTKPGMLSLGVVLLAIFGSQYAFVRRRDLFAVYVAGALFLIAYATFRGWWSDASLALPVLMIVVAFAVASLAGAMQIVTMNTLVAERLRKVELPYLDALTGLQTRAVFFERLQSALASARRRRHDVAILYVDLDRFKAINDTRGHGAGDQVLVQVGCRLKRAVRTDEIAARIGGDEFVILLPHVERFNEPEEAAARIARVLDEPFSLDGENLVLGASIGIARSPYDGFDCERLLASADAAMYAQKRGVLKHA